MIHPEEQSLFPIGHLEIIAPAETETPTFRPEIEVNEVATEVMPGWPLVHSGNAPGRSWQLAANALTLARLAGGMALSYHLARSTAPPTTWTTTAAATAIAATDMVDGWCARQGQARGAPKSSFGAYADQLTDKVLANGLQYALVRNNDRQGAQLTARVLRWATAVTLTRDVVITGLRVLTDIVDAPVDTSAKKAGKVKAAAQFAGLITAMSPLTRSRPIKRASIAGIMASTYLSVSSGVEYARMYSRAIKQRPRK